jgi:hypothetical protein
MMNAILYSVWAAQIVTLIFIESSRRDMRKRFEKIERKLGA